ncbi:MAG: glutamine--fructose-6-phosphate aminotransferase, partial [Methyloceanibacter sp.]
SDADPASAGCAVQTALAVPSVHPFVSPLVYAVPIQLIAYYTAVFMGTDVDQPRNLAKSVTVE